MPERRADRPERSFQAAAQQPSERPRSPDLPLATALQARQSAGRDVPASAEEANTPQQHAAQPWSQCSGQYDSSAARPDRRQSREV
ncbi:hypothetical protein G6F24_018343 [Rhizopus arrhizus]|nr:hypothetical protein G6F24_018343 [Rhizopus arrhizus]